MEKIANRVVYGHTLLELGKSNPNVVVLDADLSNATQTHFFAREFPQRFFNMGIAEQNLMGTAAGLATLGYVPFVSTFAVFASMRALEQFRNMIAYPNLNVKVVVTHSGTENGGDGASHQSIEDLAIMRSIPNVNVFIPSDPVTTRQAVLAATKQTGPVYVRLGRLPAPRIHANGFVFQAGKSAQLTSGKDVAIVAAGNMVSTALEAREVLLQRGIEARVIDLLSVKPLDRDLLLDAARHTKGMITVEDHNVLGGVGGAISELLTENYPTKLIRIGLQDHFGATGDPLILRKNFGLTAENITKAAERLLS